MLQSGGESGGDDPGSCSDDAHRSWMRSCCRKKYNALLRSLHAVSHISASTLNLSCSPPSTAFQP